MSGRGGLGLVVPKRNYSKQRYHSNLPRFSSWLFEEPSPLLHRHHHHPRPLRHHFVRFLHQHHHFQMVEETWVYRTEIRVLKRVNSGLNRDTFSLCTTYCYPRKCLTEQPMIGGTLEVMTQNGAQKVRETIPNIRVGIGIQCDNNNNNK